MYGTQCNDIILNIVFIRMFFTLFSNMNNYNKIQTHYLDTYSDLAFYFVVNPIFWNAIIQIVWLEHTGVYIQYQNDQFFLPFCVNRSQVTMFQIMKPFVHTDRGSGRGVGGQPNVDSLDRGRGGPSFLAPIVPFYIITYT